MQVSDEKPEKNNEPPLHPLDKPRRAANPACRCFLWTCVPIALFFSGSFGYLLYLSWLSRTNFVPPRHLYQNQSLPDVLNRSMVVQPLIGKDQTFDVAVSVWIRAPRAKEKEWKIDQGHRVLEAIQLSSTSKPWYIDDERRLYYPLYSDIVFRGLHLSDKGVTTSVNFTVPLAREGLSTLLDKNSKDLHATLVLIPNSPSLIDSVVNYSSWYPEEVVSTFSPRRTWPFPLGSEYKKEKTIADLALESFAIELPLLEFHDIPSPCPSVSDDTRVGFEADYEEEEDDAKREWEYIQTRGIWHPHIITWSQIRLIEETHVMNLEAYDRAHRGLKQTSCGQGSGYTPFAGLCYKSYPRTGMIETKFQLEVEDAEGGKHTEWAYAPYWMSLPEVPGPMDLVPLPIDRANCANKSVNSTLSSDHSNDVESMNVTWHISFSGRTPLKAGIGSFLHPPTTFNYSQSEYDIVKAQDEAELWNGVRGVIKSDAHPRRRIVLTTTYFLTGALASALSKVYWYTRNSTISISIPGTLLLAAGSFCLFIKHLFAIREKAHLDAILLTILTFMFDIPEIILQLMVALRAELGWRGRVPASRRIHASHRERASHRLDMTISWYNRLALLCFVFFFFYAVPESYHILISPLHPEEPTEIETIADWYARIFSYLHTSCWITGLVSQIVLNHKSGHFAGMYKSEAYLLFLAAITRLLDFVPALVGRYQTRSSLFLYSVIEGFVFLVFTYQALTLPAPSQFGSDEDEN
ncbi:hypothetical protein K435DRAFT_775406 [Dendrothele bispora CBS 962.96]|uniref:Uncharacterized protein n=1 Tax=Dendrothele bispora (strain CBS 962.96) TaxID=1314807 RepID=A0A4S8MJ23_DENBC|nr:hypothetical protein K435DRAFT_775406 [Dendrothele bispora CBS 962.96]